MFAGDQTLEGMGLKTIRSEYRPWISMTFLVTTATALSHFVSEGIASLRQKIVERKTLKQAHQRLHKLTPDETAVLSGYVLGQTRTRRFSLYDGTAGGLRQAGVLFCPNNIGNPDAWSFNIQGWAWDYLNKHRELLELPTHRDAPRENGTLTR